MESYDPNIRQLHFSLQALRAVVIVMAFVGVSFLLMGSASSSVDNSFSHYEEHSEALKILRN